MFGHKSSSSHGNIDTLIGVSSIFEGNIQSQGTVRIDGKVIGDVRVDGDVFLGCSGMITGNIYATNVYLSGALEGNITASGSLKLLSTAKLYGDIQVHSFIADEGGVFEGKCSMVDTTEENQVFLPENPSKKSLTAKDYKKSSVLEQVYEDRKNELTTD
ncbi:cytoskeletal protein CcmA (bactofilin family) [Anaerobacterium chartisolvens]|uniref:Cytoskeletal protein CcmA (Bactofilin family) n=1 Tax=Anaerobacterium chartisolvens TaxID=1297424 RepID=A0A369BCR6_9FIRM|nr:polymer-forming cytoskeletal protein [Anaerobacterium chartisolvens]RCX17464.1 cytoskeletal protein CcmA (bactofilin family) [Anaerobacterium chartisolvens]